MPYKRAGTARYWITVGGVRKSSGTEDFTAAKALEDKLNHDLWLQERLGIEPPHSWQEAVVKFLKESKHKASYETIKQRLAWWDTHLGKIADIRQINRDLIDKTLCKHRTVTPLPSPGNTTANKYAIVVGSVLSAACREWGWTQSSPKIRRYPEPDHRRAFLTVEQWRRLEAELPGHLLLPARFALATGLRAGKVFGLEWSQIDTKAWTLKTEGNKQKRGNLIPLNKTARGVIEEIQANPLRHLTRVFTYNGVPLADYGQAWFKAMERAGLGTITTTKDAAGKKHIHWDGFTWHGFRHTFASWLGQSGASEMVIDQLCGWAEKDTRGIYTHLNTETLRPFSEVIDAQLATQPVIKLATATA